MKGRPNYVRYNRGWVMIRRHLPIILKPLIWAGSLSLIWLLVLKPAGIGFSKEAENPLLFIVLPLVSFIYVIFAGIAISSVFDEYKELSRAVVSKDKAHFLIHRDEQIPIVMHILLWVPSSLLILTTLLFSYANDVVGFFTIFSVVFIVVTAWVVCVDLDDYMKGIWFKERIPKDWIEEDIEKFFNNKKSKD
jgi:hypothetical protein